MRDFLTGLAIVLIVVLTTALAAPYFVDWNGQRGFLERRLTHALGQKVTIGGNIDLKLLPTPYLVLDQTVIGGDDGPITIGIHHLDLELSVAPLLHGEFDFTNARLEEPIMRVTLQRDRTLPALPPAPAFAADVRFDHVAIADGTLAIADPRSGHTFVFDHLDFDADAPALAGPYKAGGTAGAADARTKFRFGTTAAEKAKTHVHLAIDETPAHAGLDLDGTLALIGDGKDTLRQTFAGTAALTGRLRPSDAAAVAWRLAGPVTADPSGATLTKGELRIGPETAGLTLGASGQGDFGAAPRFHLDLAAKQLDIDRLAGAPVDAVKPPPPKLPDVATLRRALAAVAPPLPTSVDLAVASATWGGEAFADIALHLGGDVARRTVTISGEGPGGSRVSLDGTLIASGATQFDGTVDAAASNLPAALAWLASVAPQLPPAGAGVPFKQAALQGHVAVGDGSLALSAMALDLDRTALTGTLRLDSGRQPTLLTAKLEAKALDLDDLPSVRALRGGSDALDLDVALDAAAIKVSRLGGGALRAGHIALAFARTGPRFDLKQFRADDLGGATIAASGHLDAQGGALALSLDAQKLDAASALARALYPGDVADAFVARAPALAPAKLQLDATLANDKSGALASASGTVAGTLGATRIDARLAPGEGGAVVLEGQAQAPEGSALLRQLGFAALPIDTLGASAVRLEAHGAADRPLATTLSAHFGDTKLAIAGRFDLLALGRKARRLSGAGTASLTSADLGPLLETLAIAAPDLSGRLPAEANAGLAFGGAGFALSDLEAKIADMAATGSLQWEKAGERPMLTGSLDVDRIALSTLLGLAIGPPRPAAPGAEWSSAAFGSGLLDSPSADIALKAKVLDLGHGLVATQASLDMGLAPQLVTLQHLSAALAGGHVQGDVRLRHDGLQATIEGKLALDRVFADLPGLRTHVSGHLDYAGGGPDPAALVASLAGTGAVTLADLTIPRAGPAGLRKVFDEVEADELAVDEESIVRALESNATPLDAGSRTFIASLAGGTLHLLPKTPAAAPTGAPTGDSTIEAAFDLGRGTLDARVTQTLASLPKGWSGSAPSIVVTLAGPPLALKRGFAVGGFINAVATRALARESARLEAYEFDIKERAFFNERLSSERRREQDRLRAEADARAAAEAARKAALEAARRVEAERRAKAAAEAARKAEARAAQKAAREQAEEKAARDEDEAARARSERPAGQPRQEQAPPTQEQAPPTRERASPERDDTPASERRASEAPPR